VTAALLSGCQGKANSPPDDGRAALSTAVTSVSTARGALINAVQAVESGATAVDATDALCAKGRGIAARASQRSGAPAVSTAKAAARNLPTLVTNYRASLSSLDRASKAVSGPALAALKAVVRDGEAEATAVAQFAEVVRTAWQQYAALDGQEQLWIKRAVTPWYRTDQEGANAYAVLVGPGRRFVEVARTQLVQASAAVRTPTEVTAATLRAADKALAAERAKG
jgi:hypothetical protein